jgi:hypothetical protein
MGCKQIIGICKREGEGINEMKLGVKTASIDEPTKGTSIILPNPTNPTTLMSTSYLVMPTTLSSKNLRYANTTNINKQISLNISLNQSRLINERKVRISDYYKLLEVMGEGIADNLAHLAEYEEQSIN